VRVVRRAHILEIGYSACFFFASSLCFFLDDSMISMIFLSMISFQVSGPRLDGEELMRLLEGLHSEVRDFELVYEGEIRDAETAPEELKKIGSPRRQCSFQGSYAYRSVDGAAYLDLFEKRLDPTQDDIRSTYAQLRGKSFELVRSPDQKGSRLPSIGQTGPVGAFGFPGSPERFLYMRQWRSIGYSIGGAGYECEGWEEIDGNAVLRISIDYAPKAPWRVIWRYWIDLKRGGHVLREEMRKGADLWWRLDGVQLARVKAGTGKEIWFPVRAEFDSFLFGTKVQASPVLHESYRVVQGTLVFNRGLPDERFSIEWKGHRAETATLKKAAEEYRSTPKLALSRLRTDPARVQEDQEKRLAEADRQAGQLDASPPSRLGWNWNLVLQGLLAVSGVGVLASAVILRRRLS